MRARFTLLLSNEERKAVEAAAKRKSLSVGAYIRMAVTERVERDGLTGQPVKLFGEEDET